VLRKTFGPKREEVAGGWRRPYNEELYNLYTIPVFLWWSKQRELNGQGMQNCMRQM